MMKPNRFAPMMVTILVAAIGPASGRSETADSTEPDPLPVWRIATIVGGARHSPVSHRWGTTPDRDHAFLLVHGEARVLRLGPASVAYAPEAALILVTNNPFYGDTTVTESGQTATYRIERGHGLVLGAAISPLGLAVEIPPYRGSRWRLYGTTAVGLARFTREVPIVHSSATNFTFEYGGGVLVPTGPGQWWLRAGYMFYHLSNDQTRPENPGLDANVIYVGLQRKLRR